MSSRMKPFDTWGKWWIVWNVKANDNVAKKKPAMIAQQHMSLYINGYHFGVSLRQTLA